MPARLWFFCGALLAGLGVMNGAFAAHGLEDRLVPVYEEIPRLLPERIAQYETGVRYQMYHALALLAVGIVGSRKKSPLFDLAGFCFLMGIVVFSGLLYLLVFTNQPKLGMIVPVGGLAFVVGWLALAFGGFIALKDPPAAPELTPQEKALKEMEA